jgi:hypothetical protein
MSRCPTCGRPVPTIFEHIDVDCENWPSDWTMVDLKIPDSPTETKEPQACAPQQN